MFSLFQDLKPEDRFVAFIATLIVLLFAVIAVASMFFPVRSDAEIKQTVIALVMLAAGFYLGSSASGRTKDKVISDIAQLPISSDALKAASVVAPAAAAVAAPPAAEIAAPPAAEKAVAEALAQGRPPRADQQKPAEEH